MAYTEQQLQALRDALANGVRRVRFGDREIQYRTVDELNQAISVAEADVANVRDAREGRGAQSRDVGGCRPRYGRRPVLR